MNDSAGFVPLAKAGSTAGDPIAEKVLRAIDHAILDQLYGELQTADGRACADMVSRLLQWLTVRVARLGQLSISHDEALEHLLAEAQSLRRTSESRAPADLGVALGTLSNGSSQAQRDLFQRFLTVEENFLRAQDPEPDQGSADSYSGGRQNKRAQATASEHPVTDETLTRYLRARFPADPDIRAGDTQRLPGGLGKDTVLFRISGSRDHDGVVVLRKDLPFLPSGGTVVDEFPILQAVSAQGIPVPAPLWCEEDYTWLGAPFLVLGHVRGSTDIRGWVKNPDACRHFADMLAKSMARIHSITPKDFNRADFEQKCAADGTADYISRTRDFYRSRSARPNLRIESGFNWLLANLPRDPQREPSLVHGDIGFHNLMMEDGRVTAILDWEYAHFGEPAEDLNYCRPFVEAVLPWAEFLQMYLAHGGQHYDDAQDSYYSVWRELRNSCGCVGALDAFSRAPIGSVKLATAGLIYGPRFELAALRNMLQC